MRGSVSEDGGARCDVVRWMGLGILRNRAPPLIWRVRGICMDPGDATDRQFLPQPFRFRGPTSTSASQRCISAWTSRRHSQLPIYLLGGRGFVLIVLPPPSPTISRFPSSLLGDRLNLPLSLIVLFSPTPSSNSSLVHIFTATSAVLFIFIPRPCILCY